MVPVASFIRVRYPGLNERKIVIFKGSVSTVNFSIRFLIFQFKLEVGTCRAGIGLTDMTNSESGKF